METFARANAYRAVPKGCAITISPARHPGLEAPLGWELSQGARQDLKNGLVRDNEKKPREQPIVLLQRLQGWLGVSPTAGLMGCIP